MLDSYSNNSIFVRDKALYDFDLKDTII